MAGRKKIISVFVIFLTLIITVSSAFSKTDELRKKLDSYISANGGNNISVHIEDISGNYIYKKNADKVVPAASIIKVPLMVEIMERIKAPDKNLTLNSTLRLTDQDKVQGAGELRNHDSGEHIAISRLLELMITKSDNTATNMLMSYTGFEPVNSLMKKLGMNKSKLELKMFDLKAYAQGKDNVTTAGDMSLIMKKIYLQQVATPELCNEMINIMKRTKNRKAIPSLLPEGIKVAHKTGSLNGIYGNSGIVFTKTPFIISVFVQNRSIADSERIIADISKIAYENFK